MDICKELNYKFNPLKVWEQKREYTRLERRGKYFCGKCGLSLEVCNCNIPLREIEKNEKIKTKKGYVDNSFYYVIGETHDNQFVMRYFLIWLDEEIGKPHSEAYCHEVMRIAINQKGKLTFARKEVYSFMYYWDWKLETDFKKTKASDRYDFLLKSKYIGACRKPSWLKYLNIRDYEKVNAESEKFELYGRKITLNNWIIEYLKNPTLIETMCECNRYDLLGYKFGSYNFTYNNELMFMLRKGKTIPDKQWKDYVAGLKMLNKDTHNIDILCPKDFYKANKSVEKQCNKIKNEKELTNNIADFNEHYLERVKKISGIEFGNDSFSVTILPDVKAFYEEGQSMCHCVYRMGYYKRDDSFIFSVKKDKKRIETAELKINDRNKLYVAQCYGYGDKATEHHQEILKLLKSKLNQIQQFI